MIMIDEYSLAINLGMLHFTIDGSCIQLTIVNTVVFLTFG